MMDTATNKCQIVNCIELFKVPIACLTMTETVKLINNRITEGQFTQHMAINVAKIVNMRRNSLLKNSILQSDIINIDGIGLLWAARFLGFTIPERVAGIDLFFNLIELSVQQNYPIFLLGAESEIIEQTVQRIRGEFPRVNIVDYHHGYFWQNEEEVVNVIRRSNAKMLFVAMSSPKKEIFINQWKDKLNVDFVMGVGGSFDVIAGKIKRAPQWMQQAGLEWFFRFIQEPRRMWKRYLYTNTVFIFMVAKTKWFMRQTSIFEKKG